MVECNRSNGSNARKHGCELQRQGELPREAKAVSVRVGARVAIGLSIGARGVAITRLEAVEVELSSSSFTGASL